MSVSPPARAAAPTRRPSPSGASLWRGESWSIGSSASGEAEFVRPRKRWLRVVGLAGRNVEL